MADKPLPTSHPSSPGGERPATGESAALVVGHSPLNQRKPDNRDAMAEMAERAQMISQEAGTKITAAMKDVIAAAAGLAGFAVESARDLVQYMVRRGQISQDEADKLIREAEDSHGRRAPRAAKQPPERTATRTESPREAARAEPAKGAATAATKRSAASASATKTETSARTRKPGASEKSEKTEKPARRPAAQKKAASKSTPPKKRR